jgi:sodium-dependent dicarboxylate transporter 2/3/5
MMLDYKKITLILGPMLAAALGLLLYTTGLSFAAAFTASVTLLCALWWIFETIPIPATALIPLTVLPLAGVLSEKQLAESFGSPLILLFLGGFILSTAMERSGAHRRVALGMVRLVGGGSNRRLVIGFLLSSVLLSMWISNTATTLMLLPIGLAILDHARDKRLAAPLLLSICYGASLGGVGTPIGTPPNLILMSVYTEATGQTISFVDWMRWGVPLIIVFLPVMIFVLTRKLDNSQHIELPAGGHWTAQEARVLSVFACTALAWITRTEPFGGWSALFGLPYTDDAIVALLAVIAMFIIPDGKGGRLLDWETANRIPWGILLLFAGGIALAKGFSASGLDRAIAQNLSLLATWPIFLMLICMCFMVTFVSEVTSNTALTVLLMPILASVALATGMEPALLMVPAAMSASCAFMLPVGTPPNAIVFGSGQLTTMTMVRTGFALNIAGVLLIASVYYFLIV